MKACTAGLLKHVVAQAHTNTHNPSQSGENEGGDETGCDAVTAITISVLMYL